MRSPEQRRVKVLDSLLDGMLEDDVKAKRK